MPFTHYYIAYTFFYFLPCIPCIVLSLYPFSGELLFETVTFYVLRVARNETIILIFIGRQVNAKR